jgi:hypothetical protein
MSSKGENKNFCEKKMRKTKKEKIKKYVWEKGKEKMCEYE